MANKWSVLEWLSQARRGSGAVEETESLWHSPQAMDFAEAHTPQESKFTETLANWARESLSNSADKAKSLASSAAGVAAWPFNKSKAGVKSAMKAARSEDMNFRPFYSLKTLGNAFTTKGAVRQLGMDINSGVGSAFRKALKSGDFAEKVEDAVGNHADKIVDGMVTKSMKDLVNPPMSTTKKLLYGGAALAAIPVVGNLVQGGGGSSNGAAVMDGAQAANMDIAEREQMAIRQSMASSPAAIMAGMGMPTRQVYADPNCYAGRVASAPTIVQGA